MDDVTGSRSVGDGSYVSVEDDVDVDVGVDGCEVEID